MKTKLNLRTLAIFGACVAAIGSASVAGAQTVRHDYMDAHAARVDIARLQVDRARARHYHNWSKVAQDNRLIAADRFWVHRDDNKIRRAGG